MRDKILGNALCVIGAIVMLVVCWLIVIPFWVILGGK